MAKIVLGIVLAIVFGMVALTFATSGGWVLGAVGVGFVVGLIFGPGKPKEQLVLGLKGDSKPLPPPGDPSWRRDTNRDHDSW